MLASWLLILAGSALGAEQAAEAELDKARWEALGMVDRSVLVAEPCPPEKKCVEIWRWERP